MITDTYTTEVDPQEGTPGFRVKIMKDNPKENPVHYEIKCMQDIADCITPENLEKFYTEFGQVLLNLSIAKEAAKLHNVKIEFPSFEYIDD